ncbi:hypothetical protein N7492_006295 [Penicillium capsulatum]|uniref:Uncharacterized protein n=1 Tax=Penicillium capsulatum TaxID=69766 RepID=A0A9W9LLK7_9EURO|nr:hypothetical protein N7492_006295 [Penicillium capsulatum]KAJ6108945.1 hypothetical protein N7512_008782 [Penicillium capsulatum]
MSSGVNFERETFNWASGVEESLRKTTDSLSKRLEVAEPPKQPHRDEGSCVSGQRGDSNASGQPIKGIVVDANEVPRTDDHHRCPCGPGGQCTRQLAADRNRYVYAVALALSEYPRLADNPRKTAILNRAFARVERSAWEMALQMLGKTRVAAEEKIDSNNPRHPVGECRASNMPET